jgi:hypothetical protein
MSARYTDVTTEYAAVPTTKPLQILGGKSESVDSLLRESRSIPLRNKKRVATHSRVRTTKGFRWLMWVAAAILAGLLLGLVMTVASLTPQIVGDKSQFQYVPSTQPTAPYVERVWEKPDVNKLIIQQNVNCWLGGQPGATCHGSVRTYV